MNEGKSQAYDCWVAAKYDSGFKLPGIFSAAVKPVSLPSNNTCLYCSFNQHQHAYYLHHHQHCHPFLIFNNYYSACKYLTSPPFVFSNYILASISTRCKTMAESALKHVHGWYIVASSNQLRVSKFTASLKFQPVLIPKWYTPGQVIIISPFFWEYLKHLYPSCFHWSCWSGRLCSELMQNWWRKNWWHERGISSESSKQSSSESVVSINRKTTKGRNKPVCFVTKLLI